MTGTIHEHVIFIDREATEQALAVIVSSPGRCFVILDIARNDELNVWLRSTNVRSLPLVSDWRRIAYASVVPRVAELTGRHQAIQSLVKSSWGSGACLYLFARIELKEMQKKLSAFNTFKSGKMHGFLRFYDANVLAKLVKLLGKEFESDFFRDLEVVVAERTL